MAGTGNFHKTILFIGTFLSHTSGSKSISKDLSFRLEKKGWQVLTTSHKSGRLNRLLDILATVWKKRDLYHIALIDVYSGLAFFWAEAASWLLKLFKKPFILTLHGGNLPQFAHRWPGRVRHLLSSANAVTIPSRFLFDSMQIYRHDLLLIPNPINLKAYDFRSRNSPNPKLIWLRAFHEIYNPSMAPRVLAKVLPEFPSARLIMVGPDKGDGSLQATRRMASSLGVLSKIEFPGGIAKADVPLWLNRGDFFINTANIDNTPVSVIEAMACGLPVVTTDVGGIPYLLDHGRDAYLVPPNNPDAMAAAIKILIADTDLAHTLSKTAHKKVELFDWSVVLPKWEKLIFQHLPN